MKLKPGFKYKKFHIQKGFTNPLRQLGSLAGNFQSGYKFYCGTLPNFNYSTANNGLMKCTSGYCCPNQNGCCINYMELWWFWCLWIIIIAFSCFCAYHHHKVQSQPRDRPQVPYVATCSYPGPPVDGEKDQLGYCKLPKVR